MSVVRKKLSFVVSIALASTILFMLFGYLFGKVITKDISIEPIQKFSYQPGVYLISYADGPAVHLKNQNALATSAINKGIDFILNYKRIHLNPMFVKKNAAILNIKKGAGLWLWKPWIILNTLETIPENAIVIYLDTGVTLRKPINKLVGLAKQNEIILFEYDPKKYFGKPINISKREIFLELDCDIEKCHYGKHVWAGALIVKNTKTSRDFIKQWLYYCSNDKLVTDTLHISQHPEFMKQYHDEAILNTLYNKDPKGKYLLQSKLLFDEYATWHHRCRAEDYSLLMATHHNDDTWGYFMQHHILNNYLTVTLRKLYRVIFTKEGAEV
jgi:hypothetical protein